MLNIYPPTGGKLSLTLSIKRFEQVLLPRLTLHQARLFDELFGESKLKDSGSGLPRSVDRNDHKIGITKMMGEALMTLQSQQHLKLNPVITTSTVTTPQKKTESLIRSPLPKSTCRYPLISACGFATPA
jgi:hypothetical protein